MKFRWLQILHCEARKVWRDPFFLCLLVICLCFHGFSIYEERKSAEITQTDLVEGRAQVDTLLEWTLSERKENWLRGQHQLVETGQAKTLFTDSKECDLSVLEDVAADYQYAADYETYATAIAQKADDYAKVYQAHGNAADAAIQRKTADTFSGRRISDYYNLKDWTHYFAYDRGMLACLFVLLYGAVSIAVKEQQGDVSYVVYATPFQKRRVLLVKVFFAMLLAVGMTLLFQVVSIAGFVAAFQLKGWEQPLYGIADFQNTFFDGTILQAVVLDTLFKMLGALELTALTLLAAKIGKKQLAGTALSYGIVGGLIVLGWKMHLFVLPSELLAPRGYLQNCEFLAIGNQAIPAGLAAAVFGGCVTMVLFFAYVLTGGKYEK